MDDARFDSLAKALTVAGSRRWLSAALIAGLTSASRGTRETAEIEAKRKKKRKKKSAPPPGCPAGATACTGESCGSGCKCFSSVEGASCCVQQGIGPTACEALPGCTNVADCQPGNLCIKASCTEQGTARNRCWPLCGA
jgi:hypothetical protein